MLTTHPCIMLGSYVLDKDRLPEDEFRIRMEAIHQAMDAQGLDALLVYGDAREHGALAYLSNFIPRMRWAIALLPRHGEPRLLCSMSSRDVPAMRTMTWIGEVYSGWEWKWFQQWAETFRAQNPAAVGTIGFTLMPAALQSSVIKDLGPGLDLRDASELVEAKDDAKRPRELSLIRSACEAAAGAAEIFAKTWAETGEPEGAALHAEHHARMLAAQDVRTMVSFDNGRSLEPFRGAFADRTETGGAYVAVKMSGYWADAFVSVGAEPDTARIVSDALDAMIAAARPGAEMGKLHGMAMTALGNRELHPALAGSVGHGVGLSLHEGSEFTAGQSRRLAVGGVYALQVGTRDEAGGCLASAIIHISETGTEILIKSSPK